MHDKVLRLKTPDDCESFAKNVEEKRPELARDARRRTAELKATAYGVEKDSEHDAVQAVDAAETRYRRKTARRHALPGGRSPTRAGVCCRLSSASFATRTDAYKARLVVNIADSTFELVVVRRSADFSSETSACAQKRLAHQQGGEHA